MFRYQQAFDRGRPRHRDGDAFSQRHPAMDLGRRAKIFAPFDALRGFSAAIIALEKECLADGVPDGEEDESPEE